MGGVHFDDYREGMRKTRYAGDIEFFLLSDYLERPIVLAKELEKGTLKVMTMHGTKYQGKAPVCLRWHKGVSELFNHYDAIVPWHQEGKSPLASIQRWWYGPPSTVQFEL
jgi:hypothetical protein